MSSYLIADAKLGFELETDAIMFEFDEGTPPNPKGQLVEFFDQNGPLPQLSLLPPPNAQEGSAVLVSTAEIGSRLSSVRIEFIFGGQKGAFFGGISQNMSLQTGNKIMEVMTKWMRFAQPKTITMRIGLNGNLPAANAPTWRCRLPAAPLSHLPLGQDFGSQMTAAFPLAAIPLILTEKKNLVFNASVSQGFLNIKTSSIEDALNTSWGAEWRTGAWRSDISPAYGCNSMLGFLVLVQSFVQVARPEASAGDNDLKLKISIMPRTDFRTMLRLVTDLMVPEYATALTTGSPQAQPMLMRVIESLNEQLDTKNWFWNRSTGTELRLPVTQWLKQLCAQPGVDQIAVNDKDARNGQIGGLRNKVERMIGEEGKINAPLCPILEFRSVGSLKWTQVASEAQTIFENPDKSVDYDAGTSILQTLEQWAPGFIQQMATGAAGFAFGQLVGGPGSGAAARRPAPPPPPPPPATQTPKLRPPPPPPPVSGRAPINRPPPVVPARVPGPVKVPPPVPARPPIDN